MAAIDDPKFLYVEDDVMSRKVMEVLIRTVLGYDAFNVFEDSKDFLDRLASLSASPNIFFLDVQIGPHDGYEMLRMLRNSPRYRDATVIAMTANVMSHDVEQLQKAGFSGLIGKPIMKDVFPELVDRILAGEPVWYVP